MKTKKIKIIITRGWLKRQKCAEYSDSKMKLHYVGNPKYEIMDRNLRNGNPVIVKVFINKVIPHWVLITGKKGHDYFANDPLNERGGIIKLSELWRLYIFASCVQQSRESIRPIAWGLT